MSSAPSLIRRAALPPPIVSPPSAQSRPVAERADRTSSWRPDPWLLATAALALIPLLAIAQPGIPHTADGYVHLLRTLEASNLLRGGVLYPRWAPDFYLGYGYPFFNFYAAGAHLLAAAFALAGLGVLRGVVAVQILALLLYPVGAYLAARSLFSGLAADRFSRPAALLSAALYLYAPLRFRELFTQGNLSQLLALALLPWCAWLLTEALRREDLRRSAAAGFALAALVYAHHPSAFLGYPFLAVYALALALITGRSTPAPRSREGERGGADRLGGQTEGQLRLLAWLPGRKLLAASAPFLLGVLLSAPFWLPSLVELRDVNISAIETGMFNVRLNLLPLSELLSPALVLDDTALNPPQPKSLGIAQAVLALTGLVTALIWVRPRRFSGGVAAVQQAGLALLAAAGMLAICLALMLPTAAPVWEHLPLARFIAFPWRLLGPALLWAALLGGTALYLLPQRLRIPAMLILLVLIPLSVAPYLFPRPFATVAEPTTADIARYEMTGGARATASANEYLPRWVADPNPSPVLAEAMQDGRPLDRLDRLALPAGSQATRLTGGLLEDVYRLDLPAAAAVHIRRFFFPGWQAWLDGRPVPIAPAAPFGFIEVTVPGGVHELRVAFGTTPPRTVGTVLALLGLVVAAGLVLVVRGGAHTSRPPSAPAAPWTAAVGALGAILALTAVTALWVGPHTRWFRERSPVDAPATMQHPLHARFANGIELIGYDLGTEAPQQGATVPVRLYWRALEPQAADVRPFLHLDAITGDQTWANQTKVHAGDKPSSGWPVGFYVVDDYRLTLPEDTPPVLGELNVGLMDQNGERVPLAGGGDHAILARLHIRERKPLAAVALPGHDQVYRLGDSVELVGRALAVVPAAPGDAGASPALDVMLYWQASARPAADYTVFVHVLDAQGEKVAQKDGPPVNQWYPTSTWTPGQIVADVHRVPLPPGVTLADVRVAVGLYTPGDGARLPVVDSRGVRQPEDRIVLGPVGG